MNKHKYTSGSWEIAGREGIATTLVIKPSPAGYDPIWIADCNKGTLPVEETQANARLIAAAPDLLAALEGIIERVGPNHIPTMALDAIKKAIVPKSTRRTS